MLYTSSMAIAEHAREGPSEQGTPDELDKYNQRSELLVHAGAMRIVTENQTEAGLFAGPLQRTVTTTFLIDCPYTGRRRFQKIEYLSQGGKGPNGIPNELYDLSGSGKPRELTEEDLFEHMFIGFLEGNLVGDLYTSLMLPSDSPVLIKNAIIKAEPQPPQIALDETERSIYPKRTIDTAGELIAKCVLRVRTEDHAGELGKEISLDQKEVAEKIRLAFFTEQPFPDTRTGVFMLPPEFDGQVLRLNYGLRLGEYDETRRYCITINPAISPSVEIENLRLSLNTASSRRGIFDIFRHRGAERQQTLAATPADRTARAVVIQALVNGHLSESTLRSLLWQEALALTQTNKPLAVRGDLIPAEESQNLESSLLPAAVKSECASCGIPSHNLVIVINEDGNRFFAKHEMEQGTLWMEIYSAPREAFIKGSDGLISKITIDQRELSGADREIAEQAALSPMPVIISTTPTNSELLLTPPS